MDRRLAAPDKEAWMDFCQELAEKIWNIPDEEIEAFLEQAKSKNRKGKSAANKKTIS